MDRLLQDIRFGWRLLRRSPGFTTSAVLALALGVGATTAVFTLLDRVVLRPLPYQDADRLAMVWDTNPGKALTHERISPVTFHDYRNLKQVFDDAAGWWYPQINITEPGKDPIRVNTVETSGNFFAVIGVQPILGAGFPASEFYARDPIAVISHRLWRERFGGDPSIIGKPIVLSDEPYRVAGIMPPGFNFPNNTDVWQRLQWDFAQHSRGAHFVESLFRLKPGIPIEQANGELRALTTRLGGEFKATNGDWGARAVPLSHELEGYFRPALFALFGAAAFLLLITCTNVASLLLARATVREREVAVRAAIGASRTALMRQFLTESILLALMGTAAGVVLAIVAVRALVAASPVPVPRLDAGEIGLDARLLLFAIGAATITSIAFGVVPAMLMARGDMQRALKESGRGGDGSGTRRRARGLLVAAEVALAVILLVGAVLLGRSFQQLVQQDPGFQPARVVTASVDLPASYRDFKKIAEFYDQLLTSLRSQPGVSEAGLANFLPLDAGWRLPFFIDGRPRPAAGDAPIAQHQSVDENYFRVIGVPLLKGRFFDPHDTVESAGVVVINDTLARRQWPNEDPIGQRVTVTTRFIGPLGAVLMPPETKYQIVGVVANVKNASLTQAPEPAIYFTYRQFSFRGFSLAVKGSDPAALGTAVRTSVQRLDPNLPLSPVRPLDRVIGDATDRPRALMMLMGLFAVLALGLAALGIYGTLSYAVNQRQQELSVRMALGAQPRDVVWLVVRQGLTLTLAGAAIGTIGALALGRTLSSLLFGVSAGDGVAFALALSVAIVTAVGACLVPARRAAALDPLQGLRAE